MSSGNFFYGFAETAVDLLDTLGVDGGFTSILGSPWTIFLMIELAVVAPLTEETGKALGARFAKPTSRQTAFMAGVAAGVGFAIAENISYGLGSSWFGISWEAMVTVRMAGSAVHPLASGLVVMGWWEYRQNGDFSLLVNRFLAGVGVHALWNGSLVALGAVTAAFSADPDASYELISLAHTSLLGIAAAAILWRMTSALADDEERLISLRSGEGRVIAGWTILAASFLVPSAMLMLVFQSV
ncbi:MAG: PrsW family glutamic-type intramembrane protease [Acidimicrobiia bacterium]|nr:PrsW family glutamic-type intramembrane protease [Acidimicrobiia bacterium]